MSDEITPNPLTEIQPEVHPEFETATPTPEILKEQAYRGLQPRLVTFDQLRARVMHEPIETVIEQEFICLHCGLHLTQERKGPAKLIIRHGANPPPLVLYTSDSAHKIAMDVGTWLRNTIHKEPRIEEVIPEAPKTKEVSHNYHTRDSLRTLIGSHLEAIAAIIHIAGAIGPDEKMSFSTSEDCGYKLEMNLHVKDMGRCDLGRARRWGHSSSVGEGQDQAHDSSSTSVPVTEGEYTESDGLGTVPSTDGQMGNSEQ